MSDPCRQIARVLFAAASLTTAFGVATQPVYSFRAQPPEIHQPPMAARPPLIASTSATVVAVVATPTPTPTPTPQPTVAARVVVAAAPAPRASASVDQIKARISYWSQAYGLDPSWLLRIANCESGYQPFVVNHHYFAGGGNPSGLFQYLPDTWIGFSTAAGLAGASIWDYEAQAHVTAWAFSHGHAGDWECK